MFMAGGDKWPTVACLLCTSYKHVRLVAQSGRRCHLDTLEDTRLPGERFHRLVTCLHNARYACYMRTPPKNNLVRF